MMAYNEDSSGSGHDEPWIQWFCGLKGHEMFCEVERSYIEDGFNLYGLRASVNNFSDCLDLILDRIGPDDSDDSHLTQSAFTLYGLIHARYIVTAHGLDAMYNKYAAKEFGTCPLVQCQGQPVLPLGLKDEVGYDKVDIFCPKCQCVYHPQPPSSRRGGGASAIDGASFGTTFAHLFLMTFSNLVPDPLSPDSTYVPRIFGFRVHPSARQRPIIAATSISTKASNTNISTTPTTTKAAPTITTPVVVTNNAHTIAGADSSIGFMKSSQSQQSLLLEDNNNNNSNTSKLPPASLSAPESSAASNISITNNNSALLFLDPNTNSTGNGTEKVGEEIKENYTEKIQQEQEESDNKNNIESSTIPLHIKKRSRNNNSSLAVEAENGETNNNNSNNSKSSLKQSKRKKQQHVGEM